MAAAPAPSKIYTNLNLWHNNAEYCKKKQCSHEIFFDMSNSVIPKIWFCNPPPYKCYPWFWCPLKDGSEILDLPPRFLKDPLLL